MAGDWKPSDYKPRGGWRALLPAWPVVFAALVGVGAIAIKMSFFDHGHDELSFRLMKIAAAVVAMACVAPHLFSGKPPPPPGHFPTDKDDGRLRAVDDPDR